MATWRKIDMSSIKVNIKEEKRIREDCKRRLGKSVQKKSKFENAKNLISNVLKPKTESNEIWYLKHDYLDEQVNEMNQWFKDVFCKTDWNGFIK